MWYGNGMYHRELVHFTSFHFLFVLFSDFYTL
jgi:hypothetical protein